MTAEEIADSRKIAARAGKGLQARDWSKIVKNIGNALHEKPMPFKNLTIQYIMLYFGSDLLKALQEWRLHEQWSNDLSRDPYELNHVFGAVQALLLTPGFMVKQPRPIASSFCNSVFDVILSFASTILHPMPAEAAGTSPNDPYEAALSEMLLRFYGLLLVRDDVCEKGFPDRIKSGVWDCMEESLLTNKPSPPSKQAVLIRMANFCNPDIRQAAVCLIAALNYSLPTSKYPDAPIITPRPGVSAKERSGLHNPGLMELDKRDLRNYKRQNWSGVCYTCGGYNEKGDEKELLLKDVGLKPYPVCTGCHIVSFCSVACQTKGETPCFPFLSC